jgi:hypothetical protein
VPRQRTNEGVEEEEEEEEEDAFMSALSFV